MPLPHHHKMVAKLARASRGVSKIFEWHSRPTTTTTTKQAPLARLLFRSHLFGQSVVVNGLCLLLLQFFVVSSRGSWIADLSLSMRSLPRRVAENLLYPWCLCVSSIPHFNILTLSRPTVRKHLRSPSQRQ
jgi:hypothetical protein